MQYRGSEQNKDFVKALVNTAYMNGAYDIFKNFFDLEKAAGAHLEILGLYVGAYRLYNQYRLTDEQLKMFDVRPGITGWAQVNGRKCVEWNHRIELNVWYVEHVSLWLDVKILFLTVFKVLSNSDNENTGATVIAQEPLEEKEMVNQ